MRRRLIIGPILGLGLILIFAADAAWSQTTGAILMIPGLILCVLVAREIAALTGASAVKAGPLLLIVAACLGFLGQLGHILAPDTPSLIAPLAAAMTLTLAALVHASRKDPRGAVAVLAASALAHIYPGICLGMLVGMRKDLGAWMVFGIVAIAKLSDIAAMLTGMAIGKRKLVPWLSPGKTWEGFAGSLIAGAAIGLLIPLIEPAIGLLTSALIGFSIALAAQVGDLLASLLKRDAQVKDTGASVPGFGGYLDVVDSILLAAPVALLWLLWMS